MTPSSPGGVVLLRCGHLHTCHKDTGDALGLSLPRSNSAVQLRGCVAQVQLLHLPCDLQQVSEFLFALASLCIKSSEIIYVKINGQHRAC